MNTDAIFTIGKTHTVCQDFARAGRTPDRPGQALGRPFAVASDGCSSSPDTDFGARFLTLTAIQALDLYGDDIANRGEWAIWKAHASTTGLLSTRCLDATLLVAHERDDGLLQVTVWGDGNIVALGLNGDVYVWEIDMGGFPGYLSYLLEPNRLRGYVAEGHGTRTVKQWINGVLQYTETSRVTLTGDRTLRHDGFVFTQVLDPALFKMIGVATDGLGSFRKTDTHEPVTLVEVAKHVVDVRVPKGEFIQRSSGFFLTKTCPKLGWQHTDDYGVAALWLEATP